MQSVFNAFCAPLLTYLYAMRRFREWLRCIPMFVETQRAVNGVLLKEQLQLVKVIISRCCFAWDCLTSQVPPQVCQTCEQVHCNGDTRYHVKQIARPLGFDKGFYVCVRALQLLVQHNQGCIFVGVGGALRTFLNAMQGCNVNVYDELADIRSCTCYAPQHRHDLDCRCVRKRKDDIHSQAKKGHE